MRLSADDTHQPDTLRIVGELASGLAHDLNQSLGLIAGYTELALGHLADNDAERAELRRHLEVVHRAALGGGATLTQVLRLVRQPSDEPLQSIDLRELLTDVARLTAVCWRETAQAQGRPIDLQVEADESYPVLGSRPSLEHVFTNLILNAVEALPHGGSITLRARRVAESVQVEVSDTGRGMPPEVQEHIFEPFFTTSKTRGTGLGLAQTMKAVERHGGSIQVRSAPGEGTTFVLTFPLAEPLSVTPTAPSTRAPQATRPLHVLVVDDEPSNAQLAATVLRLVGHCVTIAHSGGEALSHLARQRFDAVVSDLGLGSGINGWALATRVKQRWPRTAFVLVTGWGASIDAEEARAAGVAAVIAKPYRVSVLQQALAVV